MLFFYGLENCVWGKSDERMAVKHGNETITKSSGHPADGTGAVQDFLGGRTGRPVRGISCAGAVAWHAEAG